jgi:hypothetical protein
MGALLKYLSLGGDGDEVAAIGDVEKEFAVRIDTSGASQWLTAGRRSY